MRFGLTVKICLIFTGVLVFSLALNAFLNISNFYSTYLSLAQERFRVVGDDLATAMEYGLTLGLSLDEMDTIAHRIREIEAGDDEVLSISIVNARFVAIHDTDRSRVGTALPEAWFNVRADGKPHPADDGDVEALAMVIPIINSFGLREGTCLIRYSTAPLVQTITRISLGFGRFGLMVLAVLLPLGSLLFYFAGRPMFRRFNRMRRRLDALSADSDVSGESAGDDDPDFVTFVTKSRQTMMAMNNCLDPDSNGAPRA